MSDLVVIAYNDPFKAEEVRMTLRKLQREYLVDLEDAVVAVKGANGKIKLHQMHNVTAAGAVSGGFWGTLIGLIFLNPLLGMAAGADARAGREAPSGVGCGHSKRRLKVRTARAEPPVHLGSSTVMAEMKTASSRSRFLMSRGGDGDQVSSANFNFLIAFFSSCLMRSAET